MGARVRDRVWGEVFIVLVVCTGQTKLCQHILLVEGKPQPDSSITSKKIANMHYLLSQKRQFRLWFSVPLLCNPAFYVAPNSQHLRCGPTSSIIGPSLDFPPRIRVDEHRTLGENALSCHEQLPFLRPGGLCGLCRLSSFLGNIHLRWGGLSRCFSEVPVFFGGIC